MRQLFKIAGGIKLLAAAGLLGWYCYSAKTVRASETELAETLPGDDYLSQAQVQATLGIDISAPAETVWHWLTQLGDDRSGFYSYTCLERLVFWRLPKVHELRPEWQERHAGEEILHGPGGNTGMRIARVEPEELLLITSMDPSGTTGEDTFSWAFILRPVDEHTTRLLVRERFVTAGAVQTAAFELLSRGSTIMSSQMLRTIKRLAEGR